ncbi:hydroxymethylglutaryl-CoA lyase [Ancylobacter sp. MQZ15Z-1]|uniref:Hydroxymethylglutaryl-CoA lyase n=1 Tax=Ancylobacter mangrovi TaxID=2972472 RepID=A0A9X2T2A5_9HYPH|nr:hydroxymethylglutaryl-CoA lyase [Ancylobacter mangrovi]MCS0495667.1 hydroxymethylglutaryl-CoA lyase [Ancylobacter mangrovi]
MGEPVSICEVGPRDGLQMQKAIMPTAVKIEWIVALARAGLREIEVGSFVPPKLIPQMADTGEVVAASRTLEGVSIVALVPNLKGAQRAYESGADAINVPVSVSEAHSRANTNKGSLEQVAEVRAIVDWVRAQERPMKIDAGCATAFGCSIEGTVPIDRVVTVASALAEAGVDGIVLADTVGYGNPAQVRAVVRAVRGAVGGVLDRLHLHDTMGLGIANALAGVEEGIRCFDSALGGLGGCPFAPGASGNIVTEDLVFMLESMGFETGIDLDLLFAAREVLQRGLPETALLGNVAKAGIPKTYHRAA